jgi:nucleotide-binding universal stress UspA family protein
MQRYAKILIPVDLSDLSREVFRQAHDLGRRFDSQLHLLHVVEPWNPAIPVPSAVAYAELLTDQQSRASTAFDRLLAGEQCPTCSVREVRVGQAAEEILRYAEESEVDLFVMGTHGRIGLNSLLLGSVAQKVVSVRSALCCSCARQNRSRIQSASHTGTQ